MEDFREGWMVVMVRMMMGWGELMGVLRGALFFINCPFLLVLYRIFNKILDRLIGIENLIDIGCRC
jgi:hypothetical protein